MPIAVNRNAVRDYTLTGDTSGTVFHLGVLDRALRNSLIKRITSKKELEDISIMEYFEDVVRFGLRGWENFKNDQGEDIIYESKEYDTKVGKRVGMKVPLLDHFAKEWLTELANEILDENQIKDEEAKNLESPSV